MAEKPKVAFYWCASCGGCEEAVVDLAEGILDVVNLVDIVFWPVAMDFKTKDVASMPDKSITVSFINGAIRSSEQQEMVEMLRKKSSIVVAFGACAHYGGIPGLANLSDKHTILNYVYKESPSTSNPSGTLPQVKYKDEQGHELTLPTLHNTVRPLDKVIDIDYYIPGCPPQPKTITDAVMTLLSGKAPPKGAVLAADVALCDECPQKKTKPEKLTIPKFYRPHQIVADTTKCFLAQGIPCMGIATRKGCDAMCVKGNMPCTGCYGPTSRVRDYGGKLASAISAAADATDDKKIVEILAGIPDPLGTFYRYNLAASLLRKRLADKGGG